jgi:hypothetical protein
LPNNQPLLYNIQPLFEKKLEKYLEDKKNVVNLQIDINKPSIMPKIFEYFGFIFYFFSNEHEPIYVHVKHGDCESVFELIMEDGKLMEIRRREKPGVDPLVSKDASTAIAFIQVYWQDIVAKWVDFFVYKREVKTTRINKKL